MTSYAATGLIASRAAILEEIVELEEVKGEIKKDLSSINAFLYKQSKRQKNAESNAILNKAEPYFLQKQDELGGKLDKITEQLKRLYRLRDFSPIGRAIKAVRAGIEASFRELQ